MHKSGSWALAVGLIVGLGGSAQAQFFSKVGQVLVRIPDPLDLPQDILDERLAEHRLHRRQEQLQADLARGDAVRVQRDLRRVATEEYFVEARQWDIRRDSLQAPGPHPRYRPPAPPAQGIVALPQLAGSAADLAPSTRPGVVSPPGLAAIDPAAKVPIRIITTGPAGAGVDFAVDGIPHKATSGQFQELEVALTSIVTYDGGGSAGLRRYSLTAGTYEFRPTDAGWAFYKLPESPATAPR